MQKLFSLLMLFVGLNYVTLAQQTNNWYFGLLNGLRLDFSTSPPTVSNGYPLVTEEGSASISDEYGNPLFYTDGVKIWDASTNTTFGTGMLGGTSSTQSAIIVPKPGAVNEWLVFTSNQDPNNGPSNGINYYTVSGTPGSFTLSAGTNLAAGSQVGEGLCVLGSTKPGESYWLISHERAAGGSQNIRAYSISNTGIVNSTPRISSISSAVSFGGYIGSIKANTCQNRLAFTYYSASTKVEIFDFDNATGDVTSLVSSITLNNAYGIEFSPDDAYLYISQLDQGTLHQYDISGATLYSEASWDRTGEMGQLQIAPDGKIYVALRGGGAGNEYLGVINSPNSAGNAANYVMNGLLITTSPNPNGFAYRGLPSFSKTIVSGILDARPGDGEYCVNTAIDFDHYYVGSVNTIDWDWGDGTAHGNTSPVQHTYTSSGSYKVLMTLTDGCGAVKKDSFNLDIVTPKIPSGTVNCGATSLTFTANGAIPGDYSNYIWYNSTGNILGIGSPVSYPVGSNSAIPSQVCVEVGSSATITSSGTDKTIASSNTLSMAAGGAPYTAPPIHVLADALVLKSFDIKLYPACANTPFTVTIKNGSGTTVFTENYTTGGTCSAYTVNVNTTLPKGSDYTITISGAGVLLFREDWRGATNPNEITYAADPWANNCCVANLKYDFYNYNVVQSCSNVECYNVSCVLPVELLSFDAKAQHRQALLSWKTASELNNDYFIIERSQDGIHFESAGKVKGAGTTYTETSYSFIDHYPYTPLTYYRLVQFDTDGQSHTSPVRTLNVADEKTISVYPNPSSESFTVNLPASDSEGNVTITNTLGQEIYSRKLDPGQTSLTIGENLSEGIYLLQWRTENHYQSIQLMKE